MIKWAGFLQAAVIGLFFPIAAHAATLSNLTLGGTVDPVVEGTLYIYDSGNLAANNSFTNDFYFTFDSNSPNHALVYGDSSFENPGSTNQGIANLTFTWYDASNNQVGIPLLLTSPTGIFAFQSLVYYFTPGTYKLEVTGDTLLAGGSYRLDVLTAPLPPAALLFGSGLLGLTWLRRRRGLEKLANA
jgi:hypothetical protein